MSLKRIQTELVAPKNQYNSFGKYKYRSCEDILEGVKPLLAKYDAHLIISDDIVQIGDRFYIKATATITVDGQVYQATGMAREALTKKGMDDAQVTGSASSYARKYALNGLLSIDDSKQAAVADPDSQDNRELSIGQKIAQCQDPQSLTALWKSLPDSQHTDDIKEQFSIRKQQMEQAA